MDDETNTEVAEPIKLGVKHELGKLVVGGIAAYAAEQLAGRAYDKALAVVRARRAR